MKLEHVAFALALEGDAGGHETSPVSAPPMVGMHGQVVDVGRDVADHPVAFERDERAFPDGRDPQHRAVDIRSDVAGDPVGRQGGFHDASKCLVVTRLERAHGVHRSR